MLAGALTCVLPMILIGVVSFSSKDSITYHGYSFFPSEWSLEGYEYLYKTTGRLLLDSYAITIFYTAAGTFLNLLVNTLYAYVISQKLFAYRKIYNWLIFFPTLFSGGLIPLYILNVRYLHIDNTVWIILLPALSAGGGAFALRAFMQTAVPGALIESARMDGAGHFLIYARIVLPLFKAGIATQALFQMVGRWNDWFTGLLYIDKPRLMPLQTYLMKLQNAVDLIKANPALASTPDGLAYIRNMPGESFRMATTIIVILPILFAYPFLQRYFVRNLTAGSVKE
jgi:putative aldouronate transport system permease protein